MTKRLSPIQKRVGIMRYLAIIRNAYTKTASLYTTPHLDVYTFIRADKTNNSENSGSCQLDFEFVKIGTAIVETHEYERSIPGNVMPLHEENGRLLFDREIF